MYDVLFDRFGIVAIRCAEPGVSLIIVSLWRVLVIAGSPANRWVECAWVRPTRSTPERASNESI